ncbi:hypothetical protein [Hymenobacter sp. BT190]|uniref:hypothetical protein n=1 Tax=Hymenobacter sp. BT190 TaxID=2763505 RepID=UPI0016515AC1|nr:hypothetical protein [Hymenobacter sp. BT190]MBC6699623.1 hypothetical protein [Hymenobacter sp. BT190]
MPIHTYAPTAAKRHALMPAPVCYLSLSGVREAALPPALPGPNWDPTKRQLS